MAARSAGIRSAIVLSAGLGTRMRPITDTIPKPLVPVGGRPLIAYALDALDRLGIDTVVVNVHYLADRLEAWLRAEGRKVTISDERARLLDSGGGIVKALPALGSDPFIVLNADTFWLEDPDAGEDNLETLAAAWDRTHMDVLMLTARLDQATGHTGRGDFTVDQDGRLARYRGAGDPVIYSGALVIDPAIFGEGRPEVFSLNACFDEAIARGRLFGLPMRGHWLTVGTPEAIGEAEAAMAAYRTSQRVPAR
jgi:Nucleoside-diphosphate-sugar pyrophosphorylase involved in lipopolysaccharide biosynthesis/translation initiation factor 2B, gamma/epsilon subunits (eIF-2Bgamma/eIF-2Bepsilon)